VASREVATLSKPTTLQWRVVVQPQVWNSRTIPIPVEPVAVTPWSYPYSCYSLVRIKTLLPSPWMTLWMYWSSTGRWQRSSRNWWYTPVYADWSELGMEKNSIYLPIRPRPCGVFASFSDLIKRDFTWLLFRAGNASPGVLPLSNNFELAAVRNTWSEHWFYMLQHMTGGLELTHINFFGCWCHNSIHSNALPIHCLRLIQNLDHGWHGMVMRRFMIGNYNSHTKLRIHRNKDGPLSVTGSVQNWTLEGPAIYKMGICCVK